MGNQCLVIEDQFYAQDFTTTGRRMRFADWPMQATDKATFSRGVVIKERLTARDSVSYHLSLVVREHAQPRGWAAPWAHTTALVRERIRARDAVRASNEVKLADTIRASDRVTIGRGSVVRERVATGSQPQPIARRRVVVMERRHVSDRVRTWRTTVVAEALKARDAVSARQATTVAERLRVADALAAGGAQSAVVTTAARFVDNAATSVRVRVLVDESAVAVDMALLAPAGEAWTSNTDSFAASRYEGFAINSLAVIDGHLYGAGAEGLYLLEGPTDTGSQVDASIVTGKQTAGDDTLRRGGYMYGAMQTPGRMQVTVRDGAAGKPGAHTYPFEPRPAEGTASMRAKFGKGVRSLMWQFEVANVQGADFKLTNGLKWLTDQGTRRV